MSCAGMLFERIMLGPGRLNCDRLVGLTGIQSFINEAHFHLVNFGSAQNCNVGLARLGGLHAVEEMKGFYSYI